MVKKELGKKQSFAREVNNEIVLKEVKKKPSSGTELASRLKLSNATVSSILSSLLHQGLIKIYSTDSLNGLGRKRVVYSINDKYCLICVVSITSYSISITISDLAGNTLKEQIKEIEKYDLKTIYESIIQIKDMLTSVELRDVPLKNIIISLPGLINKNTGDLQVSPQFDKTLFSNEHTISKLFRDNFKSDVYLENDSKLMMLGELSNGTFPLNSKGMLIYLDYGIGGGLEFDNKMFLGSRGYAGEVGLLKVEQNNEIKALDEFVSLRAIQEIYLKKYNEEISLHKLFELYKNCDRKVKEEVLTTAEILGKAINQVISVFDLDYFVIDGRVTNFGEEYLNKIREVVNKEQPDVEIVFGHDVRQAIVDGAKNIGIEYILKTNLKTLKKAEN